MPWAQRNEIRLPDLRPIDAVVARMRPEGSHLGWRPCSPDVIRGRSGVEKIDDGASSRITACGLHPGYGAVVSKAVVARMKSVVVLKN